MNVKLGIDIGSTTLKLVVLDDLDVVRFQSYDRHLSNIRELLDSKMAELASHLSDKQIQVAITGSAGLGVSNATGLPFVQEVFATAEGVQRFHPQTDVVIELGGEDAKILFLQGTLEERMNSTCAGGTGAFIDQIATLLHVSPNELDRLSFARQTIYPIASRCGVFAKTDIQALMNQGATKEDIAASVFQAVVSQTISGLAQGRPIEGNVLFLGGPLTFLQGLRERFVQTLQLGKEQAIFPEDGQYFVAKSAALYAGSTTETYSYNQLITLLSHMTFTQDISNSLPPLFTAQEDYEAFCQRHQKAVVTRKEIIDYTGKAFLGIDAGSTTTKLLLIGEEGELLFTRYGSNLGNPLEFVKQALEELYPLCGNRISIASAAVTGYGEELIKHAFRVDFGLVETVAHYTAAAFFQPEVDFIIDIGGQDIKCFRIKQKAIDSVMLNEACSSGCGSFLETFSKSLGLSLKEFVEASLFAPHPVDLGSRCTVFMNSSVKQAQKSGASVGDIVAGLAYSVVKNAVYKVIRAKDTASLGKHIVVQGGTFWNDAVLRSFELIFGREVIRPDIAGLMGAYGAALYAKQQGETKSRLLTLEELQNFSHTSQTTRCGLCNNRCNLTVNQFANGRHFLSGNRCERPVTGEKAETLPNLYAYKLNLLRDLQQIAEQHSGSRGTVGLPLSLNMYENLPFWVAFFQSLDFSVRISPVSDRKLYSKGEFTISSDTVCYPAKLTHGHILSLIERGVDAVFYPCMSYNFEEGGTDNHYNCPVVAYYPETLQANISFSSSTRFLYPYLDLNLKRQVPYRLRECLQSWQPDLTLSQVRQAVRAGYQAYEAFRRAIADEGERAFEYAQAHGKNAIVLAGRPYHVDPEINHGIDQLASSLGLVVLSEDSVMQLGRSHPMRVLNQWTYHARMYKAADFVSENPPWIQLVQLISFGCGLDAVTSDEVRDFLQERDKLYTGIKIDEIQNLGAVKIRLRSLIAAMEGKYHE